MTYNETSNLALSIYLPRQKCCTTYIDDTTDPGVQWTAQKIPVFHVEKICYAIRQQLLAWLNVSCTQCYQIPYYQPGNIKLIFVVMITMAIC